MRQARTIRAPRDNFVQEDNFIIRLAHGYVVITDAGQKISELSQFMIMRGKQGLRSQLWVVVDVFDNSPCNGQPVISGCAAPDFIQYQQ